MTTTNEVTAIIRMMDTSNEPVIMGVFTDTDAMIEALREWLQNYYNNFDIDDLSLDIDDYIEEIINNLVRKGIYHDDIFLQTFYKQFVTFGCIEE